MSQYYNPRRSSSYNYGGKNWRLSRSKIDLFLECRRCFYIDNKLGTKRPPGYPFSLNSAVDYLLKKEFDALRKNGEKHKIIKEYGVDAQPAKHPQLDEWRENFKGVQYKHEPTGVFISGAIDDLWINSDDEYIVVDYKATSKNEEITALNKDWQDSYKRQMEVYQWLLRQNDLKVSDTGYFVYCNGRTDVEKFDGQLEFDTTLIAYEGDDSWVEDTIFEIKETLEGDNIPDADPDCDYCKYHKVVSKHEKEDK